MAIKKKYESGAHEDGGMKTKMTQETSDLPASALLGTAEVTTPSNVAWKTKAHDGEIYCCTFNTLGDTLVTGGADKKVKLWNVNTGKNVQTVQNFKSVISDVSLSLENEHLLVSCLDHKVYLYKTGTWRNHATFQHNDEVTACKFKHVKKQGVSCSLDRTIKHLDIEKAVVTF